MNHWVTFSARDSYVKSLRSNLDGHGWIQRWVRCCSHCRVKHSGIENHLQLSCDHSSILLNLQLQDILLHSEVVLDMMPTLLIAIFAQDLLMQLNLLDGQFDGWSWRFLVLVKLGSGMLGEPWVVKSCIVKDPIGEILQNSLAIVPKEMYVPNCPKVFCAMPSDSDDGN